MRFCGDENDYQIIISNETRFGRIMQIGGEMRKCQRLMDSVYKARDTRMTHDYQDLIKKFNDTFYESFNTRLELGGDEPVYLPADIGHDYHRIVFARGFYASALHEIAHWCVAGPERRRLEDFGYWYEPDGRTAQVQAEFEKVEIRPQAYEWILAVSAGFAFNVSCDNLNGDFEPDRRLFMTQVHAEVMSILDSGIPPRVLMLSKALREFYAIPELTKADFEIK